MAKAENKVSKGSELVVGTSIADAVDVIKSKLAELKHIQERVYKTSGALPGFSNRVETETDLTELIKMHSSVIGKAKAYDDSCEALLPGQSVPVFKIGGYTKEEWVADIELRIAVIHNEERLNYLKDLKRRYEELMDKEDKKAQLEKELLNL